MDPQPHNPDPSRPSLWACIALAWGTAALPWLAAALAWPASITLTGVGLGAFAITWLVLARVAFPRDADRDQRRARDARLLALASRVAPSPPPDADSALDALGEELDRRRPRLMGDLENLRATLDAVGSPVLATDSQGVVRLGNPAAERFFAEGARSPRPLASRGVEELFTQGEVLACHARALAGHPQTLQVRLPRAGVTRIYRVRAAPISLAFLAEREGSLVRVPETGVVLTLDDVTELAQAVQLKSDFVANASHELRTPLSAIRGAAETLREGAADDPEMRDRLTSMVLGNAQRLEELVRDLLDLSRLESPEAPLRVRALATRELLESVAGLFGEACRRRGLRLDVEVDARAASMRSDPGLVELVLKNLVENATKFAYEGTTIRIVAEPGPLEGVVLRVIDRGIGIPIQQQGRIFERFFQVDPSRAGGAGPRGTGLGLAIAKHAAKRLGGSIRVESVWKSGTTMIVELPSLPMADEATVEGGQAG